MTDLSSLLCSNCGKTCKDKKGLTKHQNRCIASTAISTIQCTYCNHKYASKQILERHMLSCESYKESIIEQKYISFIEEQKNIIECTKKEVLILKEKHSLDIKTVVQSKDQEINHLKEQHNFDFKTVIQTKDQEINHLKEQHNFDFKTVIQTKDQEINSIKEKYNIDLKTIVQIKDQEINILKERLIREEESYKRQLKMEEDNIKRTIEKNKELEEQVKSLQARELTLETKIKHMEKKTEYYIQAYIQTVQKEQAGKTVIHNHIQNQNNNNNNGGLQLQHFDPSVLTGKLNPPSVMVLNHDQLVDHLKNNGVCNFFRTTDRSRKSLLWYDKDGKEVRDSNGSQMTTAILKALEPEIHSQIRHLQERLNDLSSRRNAHEYSEQISNYRESILFCKSIIEPVKIKTRNKITKGISSIAKDTNDSTVDQVRAITTPLFTEFINLLQTTLFPELDKWISLPFSEFGCYIGEQIYEHVHIEPVSTQNKIIFIQNDDKYRSPVRPDQLAEMIISAIESHWSSETGVKETILHLASKLPMYTNANAEAIYEWMNRPQASQSEEILLGLCRGVKKQQS